MPKPWSRPRHLPQQGQPIANKKRRDKPSLKSVSGRQQEHLVTRGFSPRKNIRKVDLPRATRSTRRGNSHEWSESRRINGLNGQKQANGTKHDRRTDGERTERPREARTSNGVRGSLAVPLWSGNRKRRRERSIES